MEQIHIARSKMLFKKYPSIRGLIGPNSNTAFWVIGVTFLQIAIALSITKLNVFVVILMAYFFGGAINHALFVLIHECAHHLISKKTWVNLFFGMCCDFANGIPTSVMFKTYHLKHHTSMGEYEYDADLPSTFERRAIGNSSVKKIIWLFLFPIMQMLRPLRLKNIKPNYKVFLINSFFCLVADYFIYTYFGFKPFIYLLCSMLFGLGLHPLGARWIQEHFTTDKKQETFSYYGVLNKICFNVGYHNEHHDFPSVSWRNLKKLHDIGREEYSSLKFYHSWPKLLWEFISSPDFSPSSRIERKSSEALKSA